MTFNNYTMNKMIKVFKYNFKKYFTFFKNQFP